MVSKKVIEMRKEYSKLSSKSMQQAKRSECIWCGKKITRFCNSHAVPQCVLRNIDIEGKLGYFNTLVGIPLINEEKGIGEAGTFKLLCKECDSSIFQDYEDLDKLKETPNEMMLEEIALKNVLVMLGKRYYENQLYKNMKNQYIVPYRYDSKQKVNTLDEKDFWFDFCRIKKMMENCDNNKGKYKLFFWKRLDYIIPMAFQGLITLYGDLEGNVVTDIYDTSSDKVINHMHICMFPLKDCSVVLAFYHEDDIEYDGFVDQFGKLDEEEKIQVLNYIVHAYSEDMLYAKRFPHRTWFINKAKKVFSETTEIIAFSKEQVEYLKGEKIKKLKNRDKSFPCILSEKFAFTKSEKL